MYIAVFFGYSIAAVMAFCGIFNIVHFFQGDLEVLGTAGYLQGIASASWPLVAALALFALFQIAIFLEKLVIYSSMAQTYTAKPPAGMEPPQPARVKQPSPQPGMAQNPAMTGNFFHIEPDSTPPPMELDSIAELAHQTDCERTMTNIPPQEKSLQGGPEDTPEARPEEQAGKHLTGNKLSFFRVD